MSDTTTHYIRDWLTNDEGALSCAEFFIRPSYNGRFFNVGYNIKNRRVAGVFNMLDAENGRVVEIKALNNHVLHISQLIQTLDKVHDFLTKSSNEVSRQRSWVIGHTDIHDQATISVQHHFKDSFKMMFVVGLQSAYFNLDVQEMIDVVLTIKDLAKQHNRELCKLVALCAK